jgi:hypothetical protein
MITFLKWFFLGYLFIGFFFAALGVIAVAGDREIVFQIKKDGDPQKVPYLISLTFLFLMVLLVWPLLLVKSNIRKE